MIKNSKILVAGRRGLALARPGGTSRKVLGASRHSAPGWRPGVALRRGAAVLDQDYVTRFGA